MVETDFLKRRDGEWLPINKDIEEIELARELGFYLMLTKAGSVQLRMICGACRWRELVDYELWQKLVAERKKNKEKQSELHAKGRAALNRDRLRIEKVLERAARELNLHGPTMALALEIARNPDAEKQIFGGKEI